MDLRARSVALLFRSGAAGLLIGAVLCFGAPDRGIAQSRGGAGAPSAEPRTSAPSQHSRQPRRSERRRQVPPGREGPDLSEWAQPDRGTSSSPSAPGMATTNGPSDPPENPSRTPIGGLEWLIAAALGYGTYRLGWGER